MLYMQELAKLLEPGHFQAILSQFLGHFTEFAPYHTPYRIIPLLTVLYGVPTSETVLCTPYRTVHRTHRIVPYTVMLQHWLHDTRVA